MPQRYDYLIKAQKKCNQGHNQVFLKANPFLVFRWCSDRRLQGHSDLCLMQTLHHADQARTESLLLDLVVNLHHLMSRAKNPLNPSGKSPNRTPNRSPIMTPPRAFPPGGPDADVAEALEEIPVHLRVTAGPSVVDRADAILAKLDALWTVHHRADRAAGGASGRSVEVGASEADGTNGMGGVSGMGVRNGDVGRSGAKADGMNGVGGLDVRNGVSGQNGAAAEELGMRDADRREEAKAGAKGLAPLDLAELIDTRAEAVSGEASAANGMTSAKSPWGLSLWTAMADDVVRRRSEDGGRTPDARAAPGRDASDAVAADKFDSPPGWGLGLLRKSMSVKRDGIKADGNAQEGALGADSYTESNTGSQLDGSAKLHTAGSGGVPKLGEEDVKILPKGWHPADRILEGEDGDAGFGFRSRLGSNHSGSSRHHAGLRGEGSFSLNEEREPVAVGVNRHNGLADSETPRLHSNQHGLMGNEDTYAPDYYTGLRGESSFGSNSKVPESEGAESPGVRSEVSLGDGIGMAEKFHSDSYIDLKVRSCKISSDLYQPTGLGPNGTSNGQSDNGLSQSGGGLRHGFGSDLQIGVGDESERFGNGSAASSPLSTQRVADVAGGVGGWAGNGTPNDQARSSGKFIVYLDASNECMPRCRRKKAVLQI